jgi:hypothetical protein
MTIVIRRPPLRTRDPDGREVLHVPLANTDLYARVLSEDYDRLISAGHSGNWCWNNDTVKVRVNGKPERVARLILKPEGNARVGHADRDQLNLRSDNLQAKPFVRHARPRRSAQVQ